MTPTDLFAAFVTAVADSLDDPATTGADLARRAHLSRFHFDRVVTAAAGESPAAFRRRLLLERAAYRLLSEDTGVLELAIDAGYGSHEAFTRAFARAYGMSPRDWRREPSRLQGRERAVARRQGRRQYPAPPRSTRHGTNEGGCGKDGEPCPTLAGESPDRADGCGPMGLG